MLNVIWSKQEKRGILVAEQIINSEVAAFDPVVIDTKEVLKELRHVASNYKTSLKNVDFRVLEYMTFFRTNPEEEWEELTEKKKDMFESDEFMSHESLEISQQFKIEIFEAKKKSFDAHMPNITLGANRTLTSTVTTIHKSYDVTLFDNLEGKIEEEINKKKIRAGILVGVREKKMHEEIKKISSSIKVNGFLEEDITFEVMEGLKPVGCVDDELKFHYKNKIKKEDEHGRVDYAKRGFVLPVEEGEVVIEYIKAKEGKSGRTCRGTFIKMREPLVKHEQTINVTDAIKVKEDDDSIKYVATRSGYVTEEGGAYDIQDKMEIDGVSFRETGSIEAGLNSNVTINIKENDDFKDAIGEGMKVETSILNVDGSVASNAVIVANEVKIGGQTHKTSEITSKKADINVHKGTVTGDEVNVDRLEGGTIIADVARVKTVVGGKIIAREMHIEVLMSNAYLISSELIDIKSSKGSNNKLLIDPSKVRGISEKIDELNDKIKTIKTEYLKLPKMLEHKKSTLDNSKGAIDTIKKRIVELKSKGIKPPTNLLMKLKDYQQLISEYNKMLSELKDKKEEIRLLKGELDIYQSKVFDAKILTHSPWSEFNEIRFKLVNPPVEVVHNTRENEMTREMTLKKTTEDDFEIIRSSEYS